MAGRQAENSLGSVATSAFLPPAASDVAFYSGPVPLRIHSLHKKLIFLAGEQKFIS
jgi:hypothetical protein